MGLQQPRHSDLVNAQRLVYLPSFSLRLHAYSLSISSIQCSGVHRSLGTHISFVRSLHMDKWELAAVQAMKTNVAVNKGRRLNASDFI